MKTNYRLLAAVLAVALVFSSCAAGNGDGSELDDNVVNLNISMPSGAEEHLIEGIRVFARKLNAISDGHFNINLFYEDDPLGSIKTGEADIILVSDEYMAMYDKRFALLHSPFFFKNGEYATMALNSDSYSKLTADYYRETFGIQQLAAVFDDANMFISTKSRIRTSENIKGLKVALGDDPHTRFVLEGMGAKIVEPKAESAQASLLTKEADLLELRYSHLTEIDVMYAKDFYLLETFHNIYTQWLFVSSEKYETLSTTEKAYLAEAVAYFVGNVENGRLNRVREHLDALENAGLIVNTDFAQIRTTAKNMLYLNPEFDIAFDWEYYSTVYNIIR